MPETSSATRLTAQARRNRHAPYSGTGQNRCKGDVFHDAFHERGARAAPPNSGIEAGLTLGAGVAANVRRPFPKILLVSRAQGGRNETHRPLISLGYGRLKPNPVGQQRLHSTIFPFGPPRIRPRRVSHEGGAEFLAQQNRLPSPSSADAPALRFAPGAGRPGRAFFSRTEGHELAMGQRPAA